MTGQSIKNIVLGTAGHIDHGKSSLVKALTGTDPDRLKEEKERGITIDLGFAILAYPDGLTVGIVDVPGHERLIKNMLAGAGGIDIVLMVIAADEGVMPQSREHLAICELLKIKTGIVVVTKADLVDEEWLSLVVDDAKKFVRGTFLENSDIIPVSSKTGLNIDVLKEKIKDASLRVKPKLINGLFRLPIDRVFTLKGFGTVVTGTAVAGEIAIDSPVEILPSGTTSKVRGLQSHGKAVEKAYAGQRIGINLQGVDKESLKRGDVVVSSGSFVPTKAVDSTLVMLDEAPSLKSRSRVHFYTGTSETVGRIILYGSDEIKAGESCYCQFRLEEPVVVLSGDRYIIRRFSPLETIGGGEILDPRPVKRRKASGIEDLIAIEKGTLKNRIEIKVKRANTKGCLIGEIESWVQGDIPEIRSTIGLMIKEGTIVKSEDSLLHRDSFSSFKDAVLSILERFHRENPMKAGMSKEDLKAKFGTEWRIGTEKLFNNLIAMIKDLVAENENIRLKDFKSSLSQNGEGIKSKVLTLLDKHGFQPPLKTEMAGELAVSEKELSDILKLLTKEGALIRINDSMYISKELYDKMISLLKAAYSKKSEMTVAEFRDILGTTRKYALPFLEYLDSGRITLRVGDVRKFMLK